MNELYDVLNGFVEINYKIQALLYVLGKLEIFTEEEKNQQPEMVVAFVKYYLEQVENDMDLRIQELDCYDRSGGENVVK